MNTPIVSVVMSVFNGERFVSEAVDSILNQTFRDFEFIIIDDGSTDGTADILARYQKADPRVVVHHHPNKGQVPSLNIGCGLARGRYIARIDADDIALPERLERQIDYLEQNPQVALLGSSIRNIDETGRHLSTWPLPTGDKEIKERLFGFQDIPFCHVTLVFRREAFRAVNGYRTAFAPAEDYDLWLRMAERWQLANLPEPLVKVRRRAQSLSFRSARQQVISRLVAWSVSAIRRAGGSDPICQEEPVSRDLVRSLGVSDAVFEESLMGAYRYWIDVMLQASDKAGALRVMREALESESWRHINKSIVANTWLEVARIYSEQGRYLRSMSAVARALATRPVIAGRPIKRVANRLGLLNNGTAQA
jgi:tetratricopeptide (TPR) repeat protein